MKTLSRLSIAFFTISGLDVLGRLDLIERSKKEIVDWIYLFQIKSSTDDSVERCGFRGSTQAAICLSKPSQHKLDTSHITMTYSALNTLLILGDDLKGINKESIVSGIRALQLPSGSFAATLQGSESDVRFVYCAAAISYLLQDWSGVNVEAATNYIVSCIVNIHFNFHTTKDMVLFKFNLLFYVLLLKNYDGAVGQDCNQEGHAGLTFCAIAALSLMGTLPTALSQSQVL